MEFANAANSIQSCCSISRIGPNTGSRVCGAQPGTRSLGELSAACEETTGVDWLIASVNGKIRHFEEPPSCFGAAACSRYP